MSIVSSTAVGLTFIVVAIFLAPLFEISGAGYFAMFSGDMFFFHLLNPMLAMTVCILISGRRFTLTDSILSMIPAAVYGTIYCIMVVSGKWSDFYYFTFGGNFKLIPLDFAAMFGLSFLISIVLRKLHNKYIK